MIHKALWIRNYKQANIVIRLLWVISFLTLPILHLLKAKEISDLLTHWNEPYYYNFSFSYSTSLIPLSGLVILMGCLLIGKERNNQGMDFMFAFPFARRDLFLSKWLLGATHITAITLANLILMFIVHQITLFQDYHSFSSFLTFFGFMFLSLHAVYALTLFIGTVTGGFASQVLLTLITGLLPMGLYTLIRGGVGWHINVFNGYRDLTHSFWNLDHYFSDLSVFNFWEYNFSYWQPTLTFNNEISSIHHPPSLISYLALTLYLISFLRFGFSLYPLMPAENNGKIIIFKKLELVFLWCTTLSFGLLGGEIGASVFWKSWNHSLFGYYIGFIIASIITYLLLTKLIKKSFTV